MHVTQSKERQPCTTNVNDSLDDCYNDAPEDILLSIIQIHTDTTEILTITLYYTTDIIILQGRACRRWVNHKSECHKVVVNAVDKLRRQFQSAMVVPPLQSLPVHRPLVTTFTTLLQSAVTIL